MKTIFEDGRWLIEMNTGGEIFVTNKEARLDRRPTMRIGTERFGMHATCHAGRFTPHAINGLPAFLVTD